MVCLSAMLSLQDVACVAKQFVIRQLLICNVFCCIISIHQSLEREERHVVFIPYSKVRKNICNMEQA